MLPVLYWLCIVLSQKNILMKFFLGRQLDRAGSMKGDDQGPNMPKIRGKKVNQFLSQ